MSKSKNKQDTWDIKFWVGVIFILLFAYLKSKAENTISLVILIIGLLCVAFGAWQLWVSKKTQSENKGTLSTKTLAIIIVIGVILSILGYGTLGIYEIQEREKVVKMEFSGLDETSTPLAVSDLKLLKKGSTYTVIGSLKKTSSTPSESYFDFDIIFIDKHGKYIETKEVSTKPTAQNNNNSLLKFENTTHLEEDVYIFKDDKPVKVEFANIKEYSKDVFITNAIKEAQEYLAKGDFSNAQQCIDLVLEYTPTTEEIQKLLEHVQKGTIPDLTETQSDELYIIGSDKETVRKIFNGYKEKTSLMGENAIDFDSNDLLVSVFFTNGKADGVIFLSNNLDDMNTLTGEGSYVSQHYDELVKMATNDTSINIQSDLTKYNSQGKKKVASELYIGNTPYNDTSSTTTSTTSSKSTKTSESKVNTSKESKFESLIFLNVGVKVYRYKDESSYLGTIKMVDRDYKDESGKKVGAVYLEGGEVEGWYHREDLVRNCYIRSDDPYKMGY